MDKKHVDSVIRTRTVALSNAGHCQIEISKQLKISRHFVQNAIKKYKNLQHTGRPKNNSVRGAHIESGVTDA